MNSVADVWDNVLKELKGELSETTIATWFDELEAVDIQGNTFVLHCSNDFKKGYIETLFMKNIKAALRDIFSTDFEVEILDQAPVHYVCNCSKERFARGLLTLGSKELLNLQGDAQGAVETVCHYCNKKYLFTREEIENLAKMAAESEKKKT